MEMGGGGIVTVSIQSCVQFSLTTIDNEETFYQDFLGILKHSLENSLKNWNKCFLDTTSIMTYVTCKKY